LDLAPWRKNEALVLRRSFFPQRRISVKLKDMHIGGKVKVVLV
jgi:hypothetical protein